MQLSEETPSTHHLVTAYQSDTIWIDNEPYTQSLILSPAEIEPWSVARFELLEPETLAMLLHPEVELILIGCGEQHQQLSPAQLAFFYERNIGVETMTTQAACRTYNLLANEGRRVTAGLII